MKMIRARLLEAGIMEEQQPGRDDILAMARQAGLHLPAACEAELIDAYKHVRRLVALLPQPRSRADEPAHIFDPVKVGSTTG
jgi:hypothetical protein